MQAVFGIVYAVFQGGYRGAQPGAAFKVDAPHQDVAGSLGHAEQVRRGGGEDDGVVLRHDVDEHREVGAVVEGTVAEDAFTPAAGAPAFADILALVAEPAVVYLNYSSTYDMVVSASASLIKTAAGVEWAAE